ncbi:MAG: alpha/beta fold hydrolase [Parachlamydiaceae bacterium]
MKQDFVIYAIHGFLGTSNDWNILSGLPYKAVDISFTTPLGEWSNFSTLNLETNKKKVLLGYSLGGRLALHALIRQPSLWDAAIFISTHPGLLSDLERKQRLEADNQWADRFEQEPWESLIEAWNKQEVFSKGSYRFERKESDYQRPLLASMLREWSLGKQENLRDPLSRVDVPVLWMAGENDLKYCALAEQVSLKHPLSRISLVANASHRLPWEQPQNFLRIVEQFLTQEDLWSIQQ